MTNEHLNNLSSVRQLAAIMFADIVGYTSLMQHDEHHASTLLRHFQKQLEEKVTQHNGRIVNFYGDGCLCTFQIPLDAVRCGVALQSAFRQTPNVPVRIGIHSGTVTLEGDKIFGDSVNITSRIESMGMAGSILLSKKVRDEVKNNPDLDLQSLGSYEFKHVEEPMEIFAVANKGLNVPSRKEMQGKFKPRSYNKIVWLSLAVVFLLLAGLAFWQMSKQKATAPDDVLNNKIAVLIFENNTGNEELDIVGKIASDWITNRFQEMGAKEIVTSNNVQQNIQYAGVLPQTPGQQSSFYQQTGAKYWIEGDYFRKQEELILQSKLVDAITGKVVVNFPTIQSPIKEPLEGVQQLTEYILGYWKMEEDQFQAIAHKEIPNLQAYHAYIKAWDHFYVNHEKSVALFNQAIALDSNFIAAQLMLIQDHFNFGEHEIVDSLILKLRNKKGLAEFHKTWLQYFQYDLEGKRKESSLTYLELFDRDRKDILLNYLASYAPLNKLNMPELAVQNFLEAPDSLIPYSKFYTYTWRLRYLGDAYRRSGQLDKALEVFKYDTGKFPSARADQMKAFVLAELKDWQQLRTFLLEVEDKAYLDDPFITVLSDAIQSWKLQTDKDKDELIPFFEEVLQKQPEKEDPTSLALSYYYLGNYRKAADFLSPISQMRKLSSWELSLLARIFWKWNQPKEAQKWLDRLFEFERPYDRGVKEYSLAQFFAVKGDHETALNLLEQAVDKGVLFMFYRFDGDPDLKDLFNNKEYQRIIAKRRIPLPG